jgi:hypothetical protein
MLRLLCAWYDGMSRCCREIWLLLRAERDLLLGWSERLVLRSPVNRLQYDLGLPEATWSTARVVLSRALSMRCLC